jgi:hypothetical protein
MKNKGKRVNVLEGRTKEWGEIKPRQYRSRQGRSDERYIETSKVLVAAGIIFVAAMGIFFLINLINL